MQTVTIPFFFVIKCREFLFMIHPYVVFCITAIHNGQNVINISYNIGLKRWEHRCRFKKKKANQNGFIPNLLKIELVLQFFQFRIPVLCHVFWFSSSTIITGNGVY